MALALGLLQAIKNFKSIEVLSSKVTQSQICKRIYDISSLPVAKSR